MPKPYAYKPKLPVKITEEMNVNCLWNENMTRPINNFVDMIRTNLIPKFGVLFSFKLLLLFFFIQNGTVF